MTKQKLVTIGIPTYEAGNSLILTLKSIYNQSAFHRVEKIILAVDGNRISKNMLYEIRNSKLEIHYFRVRKGQSSRINDIFKLSQTKLLVLTNDDIILEEFTVERLIEEYQKSEVNLIAGNVKSLHSSSFFEKALEIGSLINSLIAAKWNKGDNYLSMNGRLIAISYNYYKKVRIPEMLWNNDAYLYLYAKLNGLSFGRATRAIAYYKLPTNIDEHLKQSKKFQDSLHENQNYFKQPLSEFYKVPIKIRLSALPLAFIENPLAFMIYLATFIFTRIDNIINRKVLHKAGFWPTDISTKMIRFLE